jgi:hypothetical protein
MSTREGSGAGGTASKRAADEPLYWPVFAVPGSHGASYGVWFDDPMGDRATCSDAA